MDDDNYEKYICDLISKVVKPNASKLIYDNVREKFLVHNI